MRRLLLVTVPFAMLACSSPGQAVLGPEISAAFDEFGYNDVAGIFNAPADGVDRVLDEQVWGDPTYATDHLVMKWNNEWDRGNAEGWANAPYRAWLTNEWNGQVPGGSGEVWHYGIKWVGDCVTDPTPLPEGSYCIWGQFAVVLSHGTFDGQHFWDAIARPVALGR